MRIGIDIKTLKNRTSGIQMYVMQILDALQQLDRTNEYFLYEQKRSDYRISNPRWKRVLMPSRLPGTLWLQLFIPPRLRKDRIDLFWGAEQVCPLWKISEVAYVTTIYDFTFLHFPKTLRRSTLFILTATWHRVASISTMLLPISDLVHRETEVLLRKKRTVPAIRTINAAGPSWTPPPEYRAGKRGEHLLFIGNIEPRKNLVRLIEALELLDGRGLSPELRIIGGLSWNNRIFHQKMENSSIKNRITLCGFLSEAALKNELLSCKAFVFPSVYEGFGIPVLEALALDCLVLTSKGTTMEEAAGDCACYFDPQSPEDIAYCIERIYQPDFRRDIFLKNRNAVLSRYTWKKSAFRLMTVFSELLSGEQPATAESFKEWNTPFQ